MAVSFTKKLAKWFFISLNLFVAAIFLMACLSPFLNPYKWTFTGFLALIVPYLAVILIFSIFFWLIVKPVFAIIPVLTLLIGWQQLSVIFAWHVSNTFNIENKNDTVLRIVSWNIRGMYGLSNSYYKQTHNRTEIGALINRLNADVVCLQEFNNLTYSNVISNNNISIFKKQFPNYFFAKDVVSKNGYYESGSIIFSKYPILNTGKVKFPGNLAESIIYADILKGKDTIRIFTTHLQSFLFTQSDYADMKKIKDRDDEALKASENIYSKMKLAYTTRGAQADMVRKETDKSPYPSVICGDFNDVPNSYTYFHIRNRRQDAFLSKSFGIGRTYNALSPTLRIDYILPDDLFNIHQFELIDEGLSDHHLLIADISLKK